MGPAAELTGETSGLVVQLSRGDDGGGHSGCHRLLWSQRLPQGERREGPDVTEALGEQAG